VQVLKRGQAFCFLPLPVDSGLPLFVNGYFELSSNRRDIWSGGDMSGEGKRRSDWNQALLRDVVTPLYIALVQEVTSLFPSPNPAILGFFYRLFPQPEATSK
jgi:sacsin